MEQGPTVAFATALAGVCAVALLGWVLAYWTWVWFAPMPEPRAVAPAGVRATVPAAGAYELFGRAQGMPGGAASSGTVTLLGVVAARGGHDAYALVRTDANHSIAVRAGEDVAAGLRLVEVRADRIVLEHEGVREEVALPQPGGPAGLRTPAIAR